MMMMMQEVEEEDEEVRYFPESNTVLGMLHWWNKLGLSRGDCRSYLLSSFLPSDLDLASNLVFSMTGGATEAATETVEPEEREEDVVDRLLSAFGSLCGDPGALAVLDSLVVRVEDLVRISRDVMGLPQCVEEDKRKRTSDVTDPAAAEEEAKKTVCHYCQKSFAVPSSLRCHIRKYHELEKGFMCSFCGEVFGKRRLLQDHEERHEKSELEREHLSPSPPSPFQCEYCYKSFNRRNRLKEHTERMHEMTLKRTKCPRSDCSTTFTSNWCLRKHVSVVHKGEKMYECAICGQKFGYPHHVPIHMKHKHKGQPNVLVK